MSAWIPATILLTGMFLGFLFGASTVPATVPALCPEERPLSWCEYYEQPLVILEGFDADGRYVVVPPDRTQEEPTGITLRALVLSMSDLERRVFMEEQLSWAVESWTRGNEFYGEDELLEVMNSEERSEFLETKNRFFQRRRGQ